MSTRSDEAYWRYSESTEKFDYYVSGLGAAVLAFAMRDLTAPRLELSPGGLELVAIAFLLLGVIIGVKRLEGVNMMKAYQHRRLHNQELMGALNDPKLGPIAYNQSTGERLTRADIEATLNSSLGELVRLAEFEQSNKNKIKLYYNLRNAMLIGGAAGLVIAKVWAAYQAPHTGC